MCNVRKMYGYELKKILRQRTYWLCAAVMVLMLLANELAPVLSGNYPWMMQTDRELSGTVIDDAFLTEYKYSDDPKAYCAVDTFIRAVFQGHDTEKLTEEEFYKARLKAVDVEMDANPISPEEREYWSDQNAELAIPMTYEYCDGYAAFFDIISIMNFMLLITITVALGGIFADEKAQGTDQLLFSCRNGKTPLFRAKMLAGFTVSLLSAALLLATELVLLVVLYGTEGYNAPVQLVIPPCMLNMSIGDAVAVECALFFALAFILAMIVMCLSQLLQNHPAVTAFMVIMLFLSMLNPPASLTVLCRISHYMPGAYLGAWTLFEYRLLELFGRTFTNWQSAPLVWLIVGLVLLGLTKLSHLRYQIGAR